MAYSMYSYTDERVTSNDSLVLFWQRSLAADEGMSINAFVIASNLLGVWMRACQLRK